MTVCMAACTHKRDGQLIKTQDGKIYMLEEAVPNESYFFREIDTTAIKFLIKQP